MAKEEMLEFEGVVVEVLPDARCRVKLDNGHEVIAYTSGRMKKNRIRILAGDKVFLFPGERAVVDKRFGRSHGFVERPGAEQQSLCSEPARIDLKRAVGLVV